MSLLYPIHKSVSLFLSLAGSSRNGSLSVQIQLPSLHTHTHTHHIHHWRGNKLFQDRRTVLFGSPLFVFLSPPPSLSPSLSNRWGILMKSALPVPICVRNEFHHFLNEGIYNETGWNAGNPCTEVFLFFPLTPQLLCYYAFTAFVCVSVCLSVCLSLSFFQYKACL